MRSQRTNSSSLYLVPTSNKKPKNSRRKLCLLFQSQTPIKSRGDPKSTKEQICVLIIKMIIQKWNIWKAMRWLHLDKLFIHFVSSHFEHCRLQILSKGVDSILQIFEKHQSIKIFKNYNFFETTASNFYKNIILLLVINWLDLKTRPFLNSYNRG